MKDNKEKEELNSREILLLERKKAVYNLVLLFVAVFVVLIGVLTMAWFANNSKVNGKNVSVSVQGSSFALEFPGTEQGKWIEKYRRLSETNQIWLLTDNHNFDNVTNMEDEEFGLEPGDSGILEYRVKPTGVENNISVDLIFSLRAIEKQDNSSEDALTEITISNPDIMSYLMSHIMLFDNMDENGKYTGLIDNSGLDRILKNQSYSKSNTEYTKIYWVWPLHLSNIISKDSRELVYASEMREDVIDYIVKNKAGFFKGITTDDASLKRDLVDLQNYGSYSILFDRADLEIGKNVKFLILGITVRLAE